MLVLDEEFPYPLNTGKRLRSYNLYSRLARQHDLVYLAYGRENTESYDMFRSNNMNPVAVLMDLQKKSGMVFYLKLLLNLLQRYPYIVTSHYSNEFQEQVNRQINIFKPDCIIAEWTPYALYLKATGVPVRIISTHNIEADIWQRYYLNEGNPLKKWYIRKQYLKIKEFEEQCMNWCNGAIAVSASEAGMLHRFNPEIDVRVVDNGVDLEFFSNKRKYESVHTLVFTGSMDWRPNQDSVRYFIEEIYPLLKQTIPDAKSVFVGRNPPEWMQKLDNGNDIIVTGTVDDVRTYIANAGVYIVPLRIGGGSRLKILEAMAMKMPIVSTSIGAEGLEVTDGKNILIADDPDTFVGRIRDVLEQHDLAVRLGVEGRQLVERIYGWDALSSIYETYISELYDQVTASP